MEFGNINLKPTLVKYNYMTFQIGRRPKNSDFKNLEKLCKISVSAI